MALPMNSRGLGRVSGQNLQRQSVVAHTIPPRKGQAKTGNQNFNGVRVDPAIAAVAVSVFAPQQLVLEKPVERASHFMKEKVHSCHNTAPYETNGFITVDVDSIDELGEKVRIVHEALQLHSTEPFDLFQNGPRQGPFKAHKKHVDETLRAIVDPESTTLVLLDRRTRFVAAFAIVQLDRYGHLQVSVLSGSCARTFQLMLRAVARHASIVGAEDILLLTDNDADHERHALLAHGMGVKPGCVVAAPAPLPPSPWAGCWEE